MTKLTNKIIAKTLKGHEFEVAKTRKGNDYRIYDITDCEEFWAIWKKDKEQVKALGYVVFKKDKYSSEYFLRDFSGFDMDCSTKANKERARENLAKARAVKAQNDAKRKAEKTESKIAKKVATPKKATKVVQKVADKTDLSGLTPLEIIEYAKALEVIARYTK